MASDDSTWVDLEIPSKEFRAGASLETGQCFHWKRVSSREWLGFVGGCCLKLRSEKDTTLISCIGGHMCPQRIREYLNVGGPRLSELHAEWAHDVMAEEAGRALPGARVLLQDPAEALVSFICSANNNVARITLVLDRLRRRYGRPLANWPEDVGEQILRQGGRRQIPTHVQEFVSCRRLCSFPPVEALANAGEEELKSLGLGYRARFVAATAERLLVEDLEGLKSSSRHEAEKELRKFPGVGPKVAACVALYGLGFHDAVPVDVHVARAAGRFAPPNLAKKLAGPLTPRLHQEVSDLFRDRFGHHAGWAQHLIFSAERLGLLARTAAKKLEPSSRASHTHTHVFQRGSLYFAKFAGTHGVDLFGATAQVDKCMLIKLRLKWLVAM